MTNTDEAQELASADNANKVNTTNAQSSKVNTEAPLIRYFDLIDESSNSYALGYN